MNVAVNESMTNVVFSEKFAEFEWLTKGITAKSPQFGNEGHSTGEKPIDYQDRLGVIGKMENQLEKSITALIVFSGNSQGDYECVRNHLMNIMLTNAKADGKREPKNINSVHLSFLIARMVIDFALNPALERNFTEHGRLYYAGIGSNQMTLKAYECTWKQYEKLMVIAIESAIDKAAKWIKEYKKQTYKDA